MAQLQNLNFRGIRITPVGKNQGYHYYLCVFDQPQGIFINPSDLDIISPNPGDTNLQFTYSGTLVDVDPTNDLVWTNVLPLYTNQQIANTDDLTCSLTDASGNIVTGKPNQGKPPVVQPVDTQHTLIPQYQFFKCQTGESSPTLIMAAIVNTNFYKPGSGELTEGGYSNSYIITQNTAQSTFSGSLSSKPGKGPVATLGITSFQGTWQFYSTLTITADTDEGVQSSVCNVPIPDSWHPF
jgi:hypothetical protein